MFDVLPRSLFNGGNGGIQLSYPCDTALSLTICNGVQNHLAPKTLHSYFSLFKLLYASSIHTRSSSPHVTDHVSQLAQEDFVLEQKSQAVMHAMSYSIMRLPLKSLYFRIFVFNCELVISAKINILSEVHVFFRRRVLMTLC